MNTVSSLGLHSVQKPKMYYGEIFMKYILSFVMVHKGCHKFT